MSLEVKVKDEEGQYARQELISWWDQNLLGKSDVLVVGAGALGNELVKCLALLGVKSITLIDLDRVERSNLSRGVFLREDDIGKPKAAAVAERAMELNPAVSITAIEGDLNTELGVGRVAGFDVILGGLDSRLARLRLNSLAYRAGIPFVDGAIEGLVGVARVFMPPSSPCYECSLSARDLHLLNLRRSCALLSVEDISGGKTPTTATTASVIAAVQVQEAVKLIHDAPGADALAGRGFVFNGITHDSYTIEYPRSDRCMAHDTYELSNKIDRETTIPELVDRAIAEFGDDGFVQLEHEIVTAIDCPQCGFESRPNVMAARLDRSAAECPDCGSQMNVSLTNRFGSESVANSLLTLGELELPPSDVVSLYGGDASGARLQFVIGAVE